MISLLFVFLKKNYVNLILFGIKLFLIWILKILCLKFIICLFIYIFVFFLIDNKKMWSKINKKSRNWK